MDRTKIPISHGTTGIPILTHIFQRGWNHQLDQFCKNPSPERWIFRDVLYFLHSKQLCTQPQNLITTWSYSHNLKWHNYPKCHTHDFGHFLRKIPVSSPSHVIFHGFAVRPWSTKPGWSALETIWPRNAGTFFLSIEIVGGWGNHELKFIWKYHGLKTTGKTLFFFGFWGERVFLTTVGAMVLCRA